MGRGLKKERKLPLRALREALGKTQAEVAESVHMDQSEVSRLEQRSDMKLVTLRRYAESLGARLDVVAVLEVRHRIHLDV